MCGIAGIISQQTARITRHVLDGMALSLAHRGPDGQGCYINPGGNAGLAHRRLAIIDLSQSATQPMHFDNKYSIVYNGEIYNYLEIKKELIKAGYTFRTQSDTEVILAAYDCYKENCLQYFDGMFAFAIWDENSQCLFAARDRFGEKPFYYYVNQEAFYFASEMKALWAAGIQKNVDRKMLLNYLCLGQVQNPDNKSQTFYEQIQRLPGAHYLLYNLQSRALTIQPYWFLDKQSQINISESRAIEKLDQLLQISVTRRLRSDVPVGSSLSGGLDSATILSYITEQLQPNSKVQTFSALFPGFEKDESKYVAQLTRKWDIPNHVVSPTSDQLLNDFSKLCYHQEEPFPSSSIYAQFKVFESAAKNNISVLLDGQGADEILAGYHKYIHWYLQEVINRYRFSKFRFEQEKFLENNITYPWGIRNIVAAWLPSHVSIALEKREFKKIVHHPDLSKEFLFEAKGKEWEGIHKPVVTKLNDILYFNTMQYGLEELLRYADRNSMAHGVEVRLPFLYHDLVKFAFSLSSDMKINHGFTKYILRKTAETRLPSNIVWRTDKIGFEPPQAQWMASSKIQSLVRESKQYLVGEHILRPQSLHHISGNQHAHQADNYEWRYLNAAEFLQQRADTKP